MKHTIRIPHRFASRKALLTIVIAILIVVTLAMLAIFNLVGQKTPSADAQSTATATKPAEEKTTDPNVKVEITPDAGTPKDDKTAIIIDLIPVNTTDAPTETVNTETPIAHAVSTTPSETYPANYTATPGTYQINVIGTINPDGSVTKASTNQSLLTVTEPGEAQDTVNLYEEDSGIIPIPVKTETIPADQVKPEDVTDIVNKTAEAVKHGDETLTGDAGKQLTERLEDNVKKTTVPEETKQEATQATSQAQESAASQQPAKPATGNTGNNKPATNTGNTGSNPAPAQPAAPAKPAKPACTPTTRQVPVYENVWVPNVVTVVDVPEKTERVQTGVTVTINNTGESATFALNDRAGIRAWTNAHDDGGGFYMTPVYETKTTPAVTHTEDRGHYENRQTDTRTETVGCP